MSFDEEDSYREDGGESCGRPCPFERRDECPACGTYWARMVAEGLWDPVGRCWTPAGLKLMRSSL